MPTQRVPWPWRIVGLLWRVFFRVLFGHFPERLPGWLGWKRHAAALLARILFGIRYHDVACPFRLMRREMSSVPGAAKHPTTDLLIRIDSFEAWLTLQLCFQQGPRAMQARLHRAFVQPHDRPDFFRRQPFHVA